MELRERNLRKELGGVDRRPVLQHFSWKRRFLVHGTARLVHAVTQLVRHVLVHFVL